MQEDLAEMAEAKRPLKRSGRKSGWHQFTQRAHKRVVRRRRVEADERALRMQGMGTYAKIVDAMIYLET